MSQEPATAISDMKRDPRRVIGLFLVRLFQYLVRRQASGQTLVPNDKASLVGSAEFMVNGYIRTLAVKQLKKAGYGDAARLMRAADNLRKTRSSAQAEVGADSPACGSARLPSLCSELAQGCEPVPLTDCIERLETTIGNFDRADAIASLIARMIVCILACASPEGSKAALHTRKDTLPSNPQRRASLGPPTIIPVGRGPPYSWPPPLLDPGPTPGKAVEIKDHYINSFPGLREQDRIPERNSKNSHSRDHKRPRRRSTAETKSTKWCEQIRPGKRGRDLSAAIDAHGFSCFPLRTGQRHPPT